MCGTIGDTGSDARTFADSPLPWPAESSDPPRRDLQCACPSWRNSCRRRTWRCDDRRHRGPCSSDAGAGPRPRPRRGTWLLQASLLGVLLFCFASLTPVDAGRDIRETINDVVDSKSASDKKNSTLPPGVCPSIDIRNNISGFNELKNCRVVEGFVQIVLFDQGLETDYSNITFPHLVEITDYLLLYRVSGLASLSFLFPNLAVIRGHTLISDYALVIYEMNNMRDVGLTGLRDIMRGGVRIEKNSMLCHADTIDWDAIAHNAINVHQIKLNKDPLTCESCNESCPKWKFSVEIESKTDWMFGETLCWSPTVCQEICTSNCSLNETCNEHRTCCGSNKMCCHSLCVGGCTGDSAQDCVACRNVQHGTHCLENCPSDYYKYLDRRCVKKEDCVNMVDPRVIRPEETIVNGSRFHIIHKKFKAFNGSCVSECPQGQKEAFDQDIQVPALRQVHRYYKCENCTGSCSKVCKGLQVDSIATAQQLRGCSQVEGSIVIKIREGGGQIIKELEESLSTIEEITGNLRIIRSFPLVSLSFLKNLRKIRGDILENNQYALVVMENQNLQTLFDFRHNFTIVNGRISFHYNPKLCLSEIKKLQNYSITYDELDVSQYSNGENVACNIDKLKVVVKQVTPRAVVLVWDSFRAQDARTLLGYVVYIIETEHRNITFHDGRDACGVDYGWRVEDVDSGQVDNVTEVHRIVTQLKPYTQYAFYVKTYTTSGTKEGAQSDIQYFRTLSAQPGVPRQIKVEKSTSTELTVKWKSPIDMNGKFSHFMVVAQYQLHRRITGSSGPCSDSFAVKPDLSELGKRPSMELEESKKSSDGCEKCQCTQGTIKFDKSKSEQAAKDSAFEDTLHNLVYVRKDIITNKVNDDPPRTKLRRSIVEQPEGTFKYQLREHKRLRKRRDEPVPNPNGTTSNKLVEQVVDGINGTKVHLARFKNATDHWCTLDRLQHFTLYSLTIHACRHTDDVKSALFNISTALYSLDNNSCSIGAVGLGSTAADPSADILRNVSVSTVGRDTFVSWEAPQFPNGIIYKYSIEVGLPQFAKSFFRECITPEMFEEAKGRIRIRRLPPGNHTVNVSVHTTHGQGPATGTYVIIEDPANESDYTVVFVCVALVIVLCVGVVTGVYVRKRIYPPPTSITLVPHVNPDYLSYVPDAWEVLRSNVDILQELGQGSFGMVYEGIVRNVNDIPVQRCAIKTIRDEATDMDRLDFLNEASVMKSFRTPHVIKLLGVVSQGRPTLVIMELMQNGDLKSYLRQRRPDEDPDVLPPTYMEKLQMALEIADGMAYLANKKFVHRDLAARNCMVTETMRVKVGDFGMTRDIYCTEYYRKGNRGLLPVRWMAPESLIDGVFTTQSDVWSYGVVLWELATLASQPYQGLANEEVLHYVQKGQFLTRPADCPQPLYELMLRCWRYKYQRRPRFLDLVETLMHQLGRSAEDFHDSFYFSPEAQEARRASLSSRSASQNSGPGGLAPLEEGEVDPDDGDDGEGDAPDTPLRLAHEVDDLSLDGSDSESELRGRNFEANRARTPAQDSSTPGQYQKAYSSGSSRESKASNGSGAAMVNGYLVGRHGNGHHTNGRHSHGHGLGHGSGHGPGHGHGPPVTLKTTEC